MERRKRTSLNEQICEEAGEWFLEFRDGAAGAEARREFDQWVRRSPDHLAAYLEIAAIWNEAPHLEAADAATLIALATGGAENVVPLGRRMEAAAPGPQRRQRFPRSQGWKAVYYTAACLCAAAMYWLLSSPVYSTGVGEQRTVVLKDGSRVEINSRSRLKVLFSGDQRLVELIDGQALFSVAKDPTRPFVVSSGNAHVRAVGTQFDVYRKHGGTVVTVVEGRVAIRDHATQMKGATDADADRDAAVLVSAGQQLVVTPSEIRKPVSANVANVTAWTQRQLAFEAAALSEVAEEFNRYNKRQLLVPDRAVFDFRISGVFSSSDPAGLIRFLRERPGIRVTESGSKIVIEKVQDTEPEKKSI